MNSKQATDIPKRSWCHPSDDSSQRWLLVFEDADRSSNVYFNEKEALEGFQKAEELGWNCHLFTSSPLPLKFEPILRSKIFSFPREKNGHIDTGAIKKDLEFSGKICPDCNSSDFRETISTEECFNCGYVVDYWLGRSVKNTDFNNSQTVG